MSPTSYQTAPSRADYSTSERWAVNRCFAFWIKGLGSVLKAPDTKKATFSSGLLLFGCGSQI
jgi:hypothetical protein